MSDVDMNQLRRDFDRAGIVIAAQLAGIDDRRARRLLGEPKFSRVNVAAQRMLIDGVPPGDVANAAGISRRQVQRIAAKLRAAGKLAVNPSRRCGRRAA